MDVGKFYIICFHLWHCVYTPWSSSSLSVPLLLLLLLLLLISSPISSSLIPAEIASYSRPSKCNLSKPGRDFSEKYLSLSLCKCIFKIQRFQKRQENEAGWNYYFQPNVYFLKCPADRLLGSCLWCLRTVSEIFKVKASLGPGRDWQMNFKLTAHNWFPEDARCSQGWF